MLLGEDSDGRTQAYIGQGFEGSRLPIHEKDQKKAFWNRVVVFRTTDATLDKTFALYLESQLIDLAQKADRATLNQNKTNAPALGAADLDLANWLLEESLLICRLLGLDVFRVASTADATSDWLELKGRNAHARGRESSDGRFLVEAGATGPKSVVASAPSHVSAVRDRLLKETVLTEKGDVLLLTKDYEFTSPSAAAAVLLGRSANGLTEWKRQADGKTLKDLRESTASAANA
ncbi:MAG: GIY-YIG nuclease family protein [Actinomycetota bacterium]